MTGKIRNQEMDPKDLIAWGIVHLKELQKLKLMLERYDGSAGQDAVLEAFTKSRLGAKP